MCKLGKERHMVYSHTRILYLFKTKTRPLSKHFRCSLHTVAKTRHIYLCVCLHRLTKHAHGICIIQHDSIRANSLYIPTNIQHKRYIAQCTKNPRNAPCIAYIDIHTIFFRNEYLMLPNINVSVEHRTNNSISTCQTFLTAGSRCNTDIRPHFIFNVLHTSFYFFQAISINIH